MKLSFLVREKIWGKELKSYSVFIGIAVYWFGQQLEAPRGRLPDRASGFVILIRMTLACHVQRGPRTLPSQSGIIVRGTCAICSCVTLIPRCRQTARYSCVSTIHSSSPARTLSLRKSRVTRTFTHGLGRLLRVSCILVNDMLIMAFMPVDFSRISNLLFSSFFPAPGNAGRRVSPERMTRRP